MDTLFHGILGAALCSRTGLAGGRRGPGSDFKRRWLFSDWTLWTAFFFGIFPDLASLGIHFMMDAFTGNGVRWHGIPDFVFFLYDVTHSLLGIAVCYGLLVAWKRALWRQLARPRGLGQCVAPGPGRQRTAGGASGHPPQPLTALLVDPAGRDLPRSRMIKTGILSADQHDDSSQIGLVGRRGRLLPYSEP